MKKLLPYIINILSILIFYILPGTFLGYVSWSYFKDILTFQSCLVIGVCLAIGIFIKMYNSYGVDAVTPNNLKNDQSVFIEFQKLIELKEKDEITEKEFAEQKRKLFAA